MQTPSDQAETSIPMEAVSNGPNPNMSGATMRRKAAKRSESWYNRPPPPTQDEDIPARKKPRLGEPLPTTTDGPTTGHANKRETAANDVDKRQAAPTTAATRNQCGNRWDNSLNPSIALTAGRTGNWEEYEDIKLKGAVQKHGGKDWAAIATRVPGRTRSQCQDRWKRLMNPTSSTVRGKDHGTLKKAPALG
jgi:hypothetical protein